MRAGTWYRLQTCPGAACCRATELATLQSGSPPGGGRWRRLQTCPGAACCRATELATLQSGSPPGGGRWRRLQTCPGAACCRATELAMLQSGSPPGGGPWRRSADVPGSRLLPSHRACHVTERLPFRRWEMATSGGHGLWEASSVPSYFPDVSSANNCSKRASFRNGSHHGSFFSWP
jgi:hypothetical protein